MIVSFGTNLDFILNALFLLRSSHIVNSRVGQASFQKGSTLSQHYGLYPL